MMHITKVHFTFEKRKRIMMYGTLVIRVYYALSFPYFVPSLSLFQEREREKFAEKRRQMLEAPSYFPPQPWPGLR